MSEHTENENVEEESLEDVLAGSEVMAGFNDKIILPNQVRYAESGQELTCSNHKATELTEQADVKITHSGEEYTTKSGFSLYQCPICVDYSRMGRSLEVSAVVAVKSIFRMWMEGEKLQSVEGEPFVTVGEEDEA